MLACCVVSWSNVFHYQLPMYCIYWTKAKIFLSRLYNLNRMQSWCAWIQMIQFSVRIKHDEKFWVLILTKKFSVRIKHEWKFQVLILTTNFAVSIKSFYMLESFENNGDIYMPTKHIGFDFTFEFISVPVISKTLEHIETFNTNCKVVS